MLLAGAWTPNGRCLVVPGPMPFEGPKGQRAFPSPSQTTRHRMHAPNPPTAAVHERHLDLRCWMAFAARCMVDIADVLPAAAPDDVAALRADAAAYGDPSELHRLHFDVDRGHFADWGLHSENVTMRWIKRRDAQGALHREFARVVLEPPEYRFVPHHGWVAGFVSL